MKIGIVGSKGVVGGACFFGFSKLGHEMREHDLVLDSKLEDVLDSDLCFICVPTPSPSPLTKLNTPGGKPASSIISANNIPEIGAISDGLSTIVHPVAKAGTTFKAI